MCSISLKKINSFSIHRSFIFLFLAASILIASCEKEDEIPTQVVYGKSDSPIVFNLKVIDPSISSKNIEIRGLQFGNSRLAANNSYIIYEPGVGFEHDELEVLENGNPIIRVIFFSADLNPDCNIYGRSYKMEFKKNDPVGSQLVYVDFCDKKTPIGRSVSVTALQPIDGFTVFGGNAVQISFTPPAGFTGYGEFIYEVAATGNGFQGEIYEAEFLITGLVQITVTD